LKSIVEFPIENGGSVFVEVSSQTEADDRISIPGWSLHKAEQTLESALEKVKPIAQTIITKIRDLSEAPQEVEVKFGIKMSAELGAIVTSGKSEINYEITLKWKSRG